MDLLLDVLKDSLKDTAQLVPFLLLTYLAMEALEHGTSDRAEHVIARAGAAGPIVGALLGGLPQCGFSAMAATLYAGRVVTMGTLIAVLLSTSDEMVPVFLAHCEPISRLLTLVGFKVLVGMVMGLVIDAVLRALHRTGDGQPHIEELCERAHCDCASLDELDEKDGHAHDGHDHHAHGHAHAHAREGHGRLWHIMRCALVHTLEVTVSIFVISFAFGLLIEHVGSDAIGAFLGIHPVRATFLAGLIGLIPNCGASVALTELYLSGTLASGPMVAGLLVSGGVGLLVLFGTNADLRENGVITAITYATGVLVGLMVNALGIIF